MANSHSTLSSLFTDIANVLRLKKDSTETIIADNFPSEINNLRTGFSYCNQNATTISDYEFYDCIDLREVDCYNLTSIGTSAFEGCENLQTVVLYDGVESIGGNAFKGCDCIINCKFDSIPQAWDENWNPDKCLVLLEPIETWDVSATEEDNVVAKLCKDANNDGMYILIIDGSGDMKHYSYSSLSQYNTIPWYNYSSSIGTTIISQGVTRIGSCAFYNCTNLTSITIPEGITGIGSQSFVNCSNLEFINIPNSAIVIGWGVFSGCSKLTSITIPYGVTDIEHEVFKKCSSLTSIIIPNGVVDIGSSAFYLCTNLSSVTIPDSLTNTGSGIFQGCTNLSSITYTGTIAQWQAIIFGNQWDQNTPDYIIHCTDGDIAKDGTILGGDS